MNMAARTIKAKDKGSGLKAGSLLLWVGWLAVAGVIVCAEMDRESRYRPDLADYVPPAFRSFSQAIIVRRLLNEREGGGRAYVEASKLLVQRPIPAENLSLYGLSAARAGKEQQSLQAVSLAAARGWHDEPSQYAALEAATQASDWSGASLRLRALLQVQSRPAILTRAVQAFMTDPLGRMALASLIVGNAPFQYQILAIAGAYGSRDMFPPLIAALKPHRKAVDCGSLRILVSRWLALGDAAIALEAWSGLCSDHGTGQDMDLSFAARDGNANPFGWHLPDQPMLSWSVDSASGGLSYRNDENFGRLLAWRLLTLAPGLHRLKMDGRPANKDGNYPYLRLRCVPSGRPVEIMSPSDDHSVLNLLVPDGCDVQKLEVKIMKGNFLGLRLANL